MAAWLTSRTDIPTTMESVRQLLTRGRPKVVSAA